VNRAAQSLGRLAAGVPKKYSAEEIARRTQLLKKARANRWPNHPKKEDSQR